MLHITVREAIARADKQCANTITAQKKRGWLVKLDAQLREELAGLTLDKAIQLGAGAHKGCKDDTTLLVPCPFEGVYVHLLCAQIGLHSGSVALYEREMKLYEMARCAFVSVCKAGYQPIAR